MRHSPPAARLRRKLNGENEPHRARLTHICVSEVSESAFGSDNGLSPVRHKTITWTIVDLSYLHEQMSVKLWSKYNIFHSWNSFWNVVCNMVAIVFRTQILLMSVYLKSINIRIDSNIEVIAGLPLTREYHHTLRRRDTILLISDTPFTNTNLLKERPEWGMDKYLNPHKQWGVIFHPCYELVITSHRKQWK